MSNKQLANLLIVLCGMVADGITAIVLYMFNHDHVSTSPVRTVFTMAALWYTLRHPVVIKKGKHEYGRAATISR